MNVFVDDDDDDDEEECDVGIFFFSFIESSPLILPPRSKADIKTTLVLPVGKIQSIQLYPWHGLLPFTSKRFALFLKKDFLHCSADRAGDSTRSHVTNILKKLRLHIITTGSTCMAIIQMSIFEFLK